MKRTLCTALVFYLCMCGTLLRAGTIYMNLLDISGSVSKCKDTFLKNLALLNGEIELLNKGDRFMVFTYRSLGQLDNVMDYTMPRRRGPKNRAILSARREIRYTLPKNLEAALSRKTGGSTDCIGALNQALLTAYDLKGPDDRIVLIHFSDGVQTVGVGKLTARNYRTYLRHLKERLEKSMLAKNSGVNEIIWYGEICEASHGLTLSKSAFLKSSIRAYWTDFLARHMPHTAITYRIAY